MSTAPSAPVTVFRVLDAVSVAHWMHITRHVGPITNAEILLHIPHARAIHATALERDPHPIDATLPPDAHEWAVQRIAINLVARSRGYNVERVIAAAELRRQLAEPRRSPTAPVHDLRPRRTTADV